MEGIRTYLKIRVIKRHDAGDSEVCADLPHLHQSTWTVVAMQPGNPGSTALGSFTIPLHPPGSPLFKAAKPYYDALTRYQRVEAYSGGKLMFTGVITGIRKINGPNPSYELTGASDLQLANMSRPFPGELLSNDVTSSILKSFLGQNEIGATDSFNTFVAANYTSSNQPGGSTGTWSASTDDGFNVLTCNPSGSFSALISKTGASSHDRWHQIYAEVTGRLQVDGTHNGTVGIGFSDSSSNLNGLVLAAYITCSAAGGRYSATPQMVTFSGGVTQATVSIQNALLNIDDPNNFIPFTVGLLITIGGQSTGGSLAEFIVNGRVVLVWPSGIDPLTTTWFPFLQTTFSTGSQAFFMNLVQMTRFTTDGPSTAATFGNGAISAATHSLGWGVDPGPTFLETWTRLATREGWYWRYNPQPYVVGTRTLGTVDFAADPGTDLTNKVIFRRDQGNLVSLEFNNNGDPLAADTALSGQSTPDGGGIGYWRDVGTLGTYGVIQDEALAMTHPDFNSIRRAGYQINKNKIALDTLGAKTAVVLRDPQFADTYRELDRVTIHDPEMGLNYASVRIMARTFTEGQPTETLLLDQFSEDFTP